MNIATERVQVSLGPRSYDIVITSGDVAGLGPFARQRCGGALTLIVSDEHVRPHAENAARALGAAGFRPDLEILSPGEGQKSLATSALLYDRLAAMHADRKTLLVAVGGGVVGDVGGFAAATYARGLPLLMVPTTLLAQVDSSVGGKTAINSAHGKNLVGAFHQPILVLADTAVLDTLPAREFRAGYAEVAKYGLLGDAAFFSWLEANWQEVFSGGKTSGSLAREHAIAVCCRGKAGVVARDERETGERALLNLGHTFGHALEAGAGFSGRLLHGEAVALGMTLAFEFSARKGLIGEADAARARAHLAAVGLPTHLRQVPGGVPGLDALMDLIAQDKKVKRGKLTFILVRGIGQAFVENDVSAAEVRAFLADKLFSA